MKISSVSEVLDSLELVGTVPFLELVIDGIGTQDDKDSHLDLKNVKAFLMRFGYGSAKIPHSIRQIRIQESRNATYCTQYTP